MSPKPRFVERSALEWAGFLFIWFEHRPGDVRAAIIEPHEAGRYKILESHPFNADYLNQNVPRVNDSELLLKRLARHWPRPK